MVLLFLTGGLTHVSATEKLTIYFYNPEINITRNAVLKNTFDLYLQSQGDYQFQPVEKKETFEALIKYKNNAIFMMSNWHYLQLRANKRLKNSQLVLRGTKNGKDTYHKILVCKDPKLKPKTINLATSGNKEYTRAVLSGMHSTLSASQLQNLNLLTVPKDIDALMAVDFGLADAALTTKSSLDKLSILYKSQNKSLYIIGESEAQKRLAVVFKQIPQPEYEQIKSILKQMVNHKKGKRGLNMLGLDDWRLVDELLDQKKRTVK